MKELAVENRLRLKVAEAGGLCEKHVSPGRRGPPDDLVTWPWSEMDLVETKCPGGKRKPWQTRDHQERARCGIPVYLLDTIEKVDRYAFERIAGCKCEWAYSVPLA